MYRSMDSNNFVYTADSSFYMHDEVNFTELNRVANRCAHSIMDTDTF